MTTTRIARVVYPQAGECCPDARLESPSTSGALSADQFPEPRRHFLAEP